MDLRDRTVQRAKKPLTPATLELAFERVGGSNVSIVSLHLC